MAVGAIYGSFCYSSQSQAADAYFSLQPIASLVGTTTYLVEYTKVGSVWKQTSYTVSSSGVQSVRYQTDAAVPVFGTCDPAEPFNDGLLLGWGIATAMVCAWAISHMRRGLGIV